MFNNSFGSNGFMKHYLESVFNLGDDLKIVHGVFTMDLVDYMPKIFIKYKNKFTIDNQNVNFYPSMKNVSSSYFLPFS